MKSRRGLHLWWTPFYVLYVPLYLCEQFQGKLSFGKFCQKVGFAKEPHCLWLGQHPNFFWNTVQCGSLKVRAELNHQSRVDHLSLLGSWRLRGGGNLDISEKGPRETFVCREPATFLVAGLVQTWHGSHKRNQEMRDNSDADLDIDLKLFSFYKYNCNHITRCELVAKKTRKTD